ncbi:hypothetical protein M5D96_008329, partial [Drosophila gunungcola]
MQSEVRSKNIQDFGNFTKPRTFSKSPQRPLLISDIRFSIETQPRKNLNQQPGKQQQ